MSDKIINIDRCTSYCPRICRSQIIQCLDITGTVMLGQFVQMCLHIIGCRISGCRNSVPSLGCLCVVGISTALVNNICRRSRISNLEFTVIILRYFITVIRKHLCKFSCRCSVYFYQIQSSGRSLSLGNQAGSHRHRQFGDFAQSQIINGQLTTGIVAGIFSHIGHGHFQRTVNFRITQSYLTGSDIKRTALRDGSITQSGVCSPKYITDNCGGTITADSLG